MTQHYLKAISQKALYINAGFDKDTKNRNYYLKRAGLVAPGNITSRIFPEADSWLKQVEEARGDEGPIQQDISAQGFLRLLIHLRHIVVQDVAVLSLDHPNLFVSKHDLFQGPAFLQYQREVAAYLQVAEPTIHSQIEAI